MMVFLAISSIQASHAAITVGATAFWNTETDTNTSNSPITKTFDASGFDKLVVIVTGENGNPGSLAGNVTSVTYDGVALIQAVDRNPIDNAAPNQTPLGATIDQVYSSIFYLDSPSTSTGLISAVINSRGNVTVFGLNGTAPGVGVTIIGAQEARSIDLTTSEGSIVIAALGMGGNGNTANVASVNTVDPSNFIEVSAQEEGNIYDGHVTAYQINSAAGTNSYAFTGGNVIGSHIIAAEFLAVPEPSSILLCGLGFFAIFRRRR